MQPKNELHCADSAGRKGFNACPLILLRKKAASMHSLSMLLPEHFPNCDSGVKRGFPKHELANRTKRNYGFYAILIKYFIKLLLIPEP